MLDESMFEDIHEIAENSAYLKAVEERDVCTEMFDSLPPYTECLDVETKLDADGLLNFDTIFHEPTGYYMLKCFLISDYAVDKAIFIKDVEAYRSMRFESARKKIASALFQRFVSTDPEHATLYPKGSSVFDVIDKGDAAGKNGSEAAININNLLSPNNLLQHGNALNGLLSEGKQDKSGGAGAVSSPGGPDSQSPVNENTFLIGKNNNSIGVYGKCVRIVKEKIESGQAPKDLFDEVAREVLTDLKLDAFPRFRHSTFFQRYIRTKWIETQKVTVKDFTTFRVLGRGGFGAVHACRKKNSGMIYAMKAINKKLVKVKSALDNVLEERNVLVLMKSNFVTNIKYALQDEETLYLVMDLMLGGDLKFHLINAGRFNEKRAKFYAAQVLLGLEHVHKLGIIYRDMKLENILLDEFGNVKVSDLGLAVVTKVKIKGYAGCLEENESILMANGQPIRVGDLNENDPQSWPLLLSESGESQQIDRVYRGSSSVLYEIMDSAGRYRVTHDHRLSLRWSGPGARIELTPYDYRIHYFTPARHSIEEREIRVRLDQFADQANAAKLAELAAWAQFAALPESQRLSDGSIVMVTVKRFLMLSRAVRSRLSEHVIDTANFTTQNKLSKSMQEHPAPRSSDAVDYAVALEHFTRSLPSHSAQRISTPVWRPYRLSSGPIEWRPAVASDRDFSRCLVLPSPSCSRLSSDLTVSYLSFLLSSAPSDLFDSISLVFLSPFVDCQQIDQAAARSTLSLILSLGAERLIACGPSASACLGSISSLVSSSSSAQFRSSEFGQFSLYSLPEPHNPLTWPAFLSSLSASLSLSSVLSSPVSSLLPSSFPLRVPSVVRLSVNDASQKFGWVGVEVRDPRHRVVLSSGSVTGNTPGYTAPEMIKNKLYGPSADIFSYGVMLYRMLCGSKPFKGKIDRDLDKAVLEKKPQFPKELFSKEATSLLTGLLQKRPENRLGCGERGIEEIKEHPFFESIDWGLLESGYIEPPFVPNKFDVNAASLKDIGDFDRAKYRNVKLDERFKQRIKNFEYTSPKALADEMSLVLAKVDENVNFEKFAVQPKPVQPRTVVASNSCCVVV